MRGGIARQSHSLKFLEVWLEGSTIALFTQVEELLYAGDVSSAMSVNAGIEPELDVEINYKSYYNLYAAYLENLENGDILSAADSAALYELCMLCPGRDGACIFQARALYNLIYKMPIAADECSEDEGSERKAVTQKEEKEARIISGDISSIQIYPNPAANEVTIELPELSEDVNIKITDLCGRNLRSVHANAGERLIKINLNLLNGVYLIAISTSSKLTVHKKLVISK